METISLEELIKRNISEIRNGKIDKRVISFSNFGNKYAVPKSSILINIELTDGIKATLDITDYFKEDLK